MITYRLWKINRRDRRYRALKMNTKVEREGWFLFGLIPLYIRDRSVEY